jgi:hypothetical protein
LPYTWPASLHSTDNVAHKPAAGRVSHHRVRDGTSHSEIGVHAMFGDTTPHTARPLAMHQPTNST